MSINYNTLSGILAQVLTIAFIAYCINSYLYLNFNKYPLSPKHNLQSLEYIHFAIDEALKPPISNKPIEKPKIQTIEIEQAPHDEIDIFDLKAIYLVGEDTGWVVIQSIGSQKSRILKLGEGYRNYVLKNIFAKYAVFERRGKKYSLYLQKNDKNDRYSLESEARYKDKIKVLNGKIKVKKTFAQKYIKNSNNIWREIAINENRVDGKIQGFIITGVSYNSVFKRLGLQKGDILISVNNKKLNSYSDALRAYKNVRSQKNIHLVISRNGEIKEIDYELF